MEDKTIYVLLGGEFELTARFIGVYKDKSMLVRVIQRLYKDSEGVGEIVEEELDTYCRYTFYSAELEKNRSFIISKEYLL